MTLENLKKKYKHLNFLIKGDFTAQDFNKEFGDGEDGGFMHMGKLTTDRRLLIISDAKKNLKDLLKKFPELEVKEEVKKTNTESKTTSKGKK